MHKSALIGYIFGTLLLNSICVNAQTKKDSEEKKSITKKAFQEGLKLISTTPNDTIVNIQSTDPFIEHSGKIIRYIFIERIGFEKSIYDSTKKVKKTVTNIANALHSNTREKIIYQHLFLHQHEPVNPAKLSDNERFLRDLDFILDSRIVIIPVAGTDSVDLTVITRDVFSLGGSLGGSLPSAPKISVFDANVSGRGQRIEYTALINQERTPTVGHALYYRKSSAFGSFANIELGFTQLNTGRSYGEENEYAIFTRINRPLVSPYSRLAGGFEISRNWSENVFNDPDSVFIKYRYSVFDTWFGYNLGIHRKIADRKRLFLAVRYFNGSYQDQPEQAEYLEERLYNDLYGTLTEFTFYKQDYFKTRYVFGFGRTEDVPYGISLAVSSGYFREVAIERPYTGIKFNYSWASKKGNFYKLTVQSGAYYRNKEAEDAVLQVGAAYYTRVWNMNRYKLRSYISSSYTNIFNRKVSEPLHLNKNFIPGFNTDDLDANSRTATHVESTLFTPWMLLGFRFAPFVSADIVHLKCLSCGQIDKTFLGISSGLRTRNENLIFGTMELKVTYVPSNAFGEPEFIFSFKQNVRIKNTGTFVHAPSLIRYN